MRAAPFRALALAVALAGCLEDARPSDGSRLEGPTVWMAADQMGTLVSPPADTLSVTLMASGSGALSLGVRDAAGRVLVDAAAPERSPNRLLRGRDLVVGMIPSATSSLPLSSSFEVRAVRLEGAAPEPLTISAWLKRSVAGVPAVQELRLALVLVGPVAREPLSAAVREVGRIWRPAGIEIGDPVVVAVGGAEAERLGRVRVDPSLGADSPMVAEALRLSRWGPADALALVVVGDVELQGQPIWALSGGIPVPPVTGTAHSGVLVSGVLIARDPTFAGQVMAHEIGHALGLYHTSERMLDGAEALNDPIDDSPACPTAADRAPTDGFLSAGECLAHDVGNLMFWSAVRGSTRLTPGQAEIARRSALAR